MEEKITKTLDKIGIHGLIAYSYGVFFLVFIFGLVVNFLAPSDQATSNEMGSWGVLLILLGTALILWAQNTSGSTHKVRTENKDQNVAHHFKRGPYIFSRSPTHIGLMFLLSGFALTINSMITFALAIVAFIIARFVFQKKEEEMLEKKYGQSYTDYKKSVKF